MKTTGSILRFLSACLGLFVAVAATSIVVVQTLPVAGHDYFSVFEAKHRRLDALRAPRVLLIGGSNASFGYASEEFESLLGMPAVNMGLHANLGMQFMFNEVAGDIDSGDIIIVSPEYEQFFDVLIYGSSTLGDVALTQLNALRYVDEPRQYFEVAKALPGAAQKAVLSNLYPDTGIDSMYLSGAFNRYGDIQMSADRPDLQLSKISRLAPEEIITDAVEKFVAFSNLVRRRGARCYISYPSIPETYYERNKPAIRRLHLLLAGTARLTLLQSPEERVRPDTAFYDTHYHLLTKQLRRDNARDVALRILELQKEGQASRPPHR